MRKAFCRTPSRRSANASALIFPTRWGAATPSGFDFEIGAGSQEIDPTDWRETATDITSAWGHKPHLRLQLKMARELVARTLGV